MLSDRVKPCVAICVFDHPDSGRKVREVQAGMEEEGIPFLFLRGDEPDVTALANHAAGISQLGVGMGIAPDGLAIQTDKLPANKPLFRLASPGTPEDWRIFGCNAARLVKGIPFKRLSEPEAPPPSASELEAFIRKTVLKILQQTPES